MVYVEQGFYNGIGVSEFTGIEAGTPNFANQVLAFLMNNQSASASAEIVVDRLIAGLEIITPSITTDTIAVGGQAKFDGLTFFTNTVTFSGGIIFDGTAEFVAPPLFNKDTAGFAIIKEGDKKVRVDFDQPYATTPIVTATMTFEVTDNIDDTSATDLFNQNIQYIVTAKDQTGFTIIINKNAPRNIRFSWVALGVRDAKVIESIYEGLTLDGGNNGDTPPPTEETPPPADDGGTPPADGDGAPPADDSSSGSSGGGEESPPADDGGTPPPAGDGTGEPAF